MSFHHARLALAMTALAILSACGRGDIGTGPMKTEQRPVGDFDSISVQGGTQLEIAVGKPAMVEVEGRELFVDRLVTEVRDRTLYLTSTKKDWVTIGTSPRVIVRIAVPSLAKLEVQGGNDVHLTGFNGGSSTLRLEGAINLNGSGRLDALDVFMAGAGNADLAKLVTQSAKVTVAGVGNVTIQASDSLDATMNGVGAIFYLGSPRQVNTHMNGLGTISQRDPNDSKSQSDPVDPDSLQPEADSPEKATSTGVI
ncbi:MAG TPA: DUF2807 domain-containing protein [Povalibacter sp.]|nr:DUF2807 domain-containing protein [Povalibacter sp.]